jgi:ankyrin repeat protein
MFYAESSDIEEENLPPVPAFPAEPYVLDASQLKRLQRLIDINNSRITHRQGHRNKSRSQLNLEKVERLAKEKKQEFLVQRLANSRMSNANKFARQGDEYSLRQFLYGNAYDVDTRDLTTGRTCLIEACATGQLHIVRMLCGEFRANVGIPTIMGNSTALHVAVEAGFRQVIAMLVTHGANVNRTDNQGCTSLHYMKNLSCMKTLLRFGANPLIRNKKGMTPLQYYKWIEPREAQDPLMITDMSRLEEQTRRNLKAKSATQTEVNIPFFIIIMFV